MKNFDFKSVDSSTWVRTVSTFIFIANMVLNSFGIETIEIDDETISSIVCGAVGVASAMTFVRSWWKNNSFTKAAQSADKVLKKEKGIEDD